MGRGWILMLGLGLALLLAALPLAGVQGQFPQLPHSFYGNVTGSDGPAPIGTEITAKVGGVQRGALTVTQAGQYGGPTALKTKLLVKGDISNGDTILFFVNGIQAEQTSVFDSGSVDRLDTVDDELSGFSVPPVIWVGDDD